MYVKYALFLNESERKTKYGIKLTWVLRELIKVFGVIASRESLTITLSYFSHFPVFNIVCKLHIFWICYET